MSQKCRQTTNLLVHEAVEDKDEDALQTVENSEEISHDNGMGVNVEQTKRPGRTQQHNEHDRSFDPRPATFITYVKLVLILISLMSKKMYNFTNLLKSTPDC